jgi:hypothetical protein
MIMYLVGNTGLLTGGFWVIAHQTKAIDHSGRPRGLRHEPSSPARTLRSWVRIPYEAWMSACVYSEFVLFCVQAEALRRADPPSKVSYLLWESQVTEKAAKVQQRPAEL